MLIFTILFTGFGLSIFTLQLITWLSNMSSLFTKLFFLILTILELFFILVSHSWILFLILYIELYFFFFPESNLKFDKIFTLNKYLHEVDRIKLLLILLVWLVLASSISLVLLEYKVDVSDIFSSDIISIIYIL